MSFDDSYHDVILNPEMEGGFVLTNDPYDSGKMTYAGISMASFPNWDGWKIVLSALSKGTLNAPETRSVLEPLVKSFYRKNFWDCWNADDLPDAVASELFEQAVNMGTPRTCRHLQQTLNAINAVTDSGYRYGPDVVVDGKFGPKTLERLKQAMRDGREAAVRNGLNGLQASRYIELALKNAAKRRYAGGWLAKRAN